MSWLVSCSQRWVGFEEDAPRSTLLPLSGVHGVPENPCSGSIVASRPIRCTLFFDGLERGNISSLTAFAKPPAESATAAKLQTHPRRPTFTVLETEAAAAEK